MLTQLALIFILATVLATLLRRLRLPVILGYILTGVVVVQFGEFNEFNKFNEFLEILSSLGIAFLLFLVGVELNFREVKEVGPVSLAVGLGQIAVTSTIGFVLAHFIFNFSLLTSAYIAVALTFSSTIIIVKLLSEKGDLNSLYGRISVGVLLVQDLVAVLALMLLSSLSSSTSLTSLASGAGVVGVALLKGALLFALALLLTQVVVPSVFSLLASTPDLLLLGSISWAILLSLFAQWVGFSLEVGAFLAGLTLAGSPYNVEIGAKIKPLRDFFIILFFIFLGMSMSLDGFLPLLVPALVLSLFVLLGNPLILLSIMGWMGYHRRVSFLTGLTVAQISEFSLIVAAMGYKLGHLSAEVVSMITVVGVITITLSSYLIQEGDRLYQRLEELGLLKFFERQTLHERDPDPKGLEQASGSGKHAILFGLGRMGEEFLKKLRWLGVPVTVIDYDPAVINPKSEIRNPKQARDPNDRNISNFGIRASDLTFLYGDAADPEILSSLNVEAARLLISTVPDYETNLFLVEEARRANPDLIIIARAGNAAEAEELRKLGAGFVIVPEVVAAHAVGKILEEVEINSKS